jgi:ectoine hydroxylase-related dioxygenase (phytanoyl-CoA dioxygenase family)
MRNNYFTAEQIRQYRDDGFLLVKGLYSGEQLEVIRNDLRDHAADYFAHPDKFQPRDVLLEPLTEEQLQSVSDPLQRVRKLQALATEPKIFRHFNADSLAAKMTAELIGDNQLRLLFLSCFAKPAKHGTETPWHQDQALWGSWMRTATSCWVALDECTVENGCLQFVRGSHRQVVDHVLEEGAPHVFVPKEKLAQDADIVHVLMEPGDGVFFGGLALHFSEPNRSEKRRLGMPAVYISDADLADTVRWGEWMKIKQKNGQKVGAGPQAYHSRPPVVIVE